MSGLPLLQSQRRPCGVRQVWGAGQVNEVEVISLHRSPALDPAAAGKENKSCRRQATLTHPDLNPSIGPGDGSAPTSPDRSHGPRPRSRPDLACRPTARKHDYRGQPEPLTSIASRRTTADLVSPRIQPRHCRQRIPTAGQLRCTQLLKRLPPQETGIAATLRRPHCQGSRIRIDHHDSIGCQRVRQDRHHSSSNAGSRIGCITIPSRAQSPAPHPAGGEIGGEPVPSAGPIVAALISATVPPHR
jgi:hypothetical protein